MGILSFLLHHNYNKNAALHICVFEKAMLEPFQIFSASNLPKPTSIM